MQTKNTRKIGKVIPIDKQIQKEACLENLKQEKMQSIVITLRSVECVHGLFLFPFF